MAFDAALAAGILPCPGTVDVVRARYGHSGQVEAR